MRQKLQQDKVRLSNVATLLDTVSPLNTLKRGYAIVSDEKQAIVRDSATVSPGDKISARLGRGSLLCTVDSTSD